MMWLMCRVWNSLTKGFVDTTLSRMKSGILRHLDKTNSHHYTTNKPHGSDAKYLGSKVPKYALKYFWVLTYTCT